MIFSKIPPFFSITLADAVLGSLQVISILEKPHLTHSRWSKRQIHIPMHKISM